MSYNRKCLLAFVPAVLLLPGVLTAQSVRPKPLLITQTINENQRVTLAGNTRSEANKANDQGRVPDSLPLDHMLLQLQRSPEQEQALELFIDQLQTPGSPNYHRWLTAAQFGQQFGLAQEDLNTIQNWLTEQGFTVNTTYPNGTLIDFSGTAGAVRQAFKTEIHQLNVNGSLHIANNTDPQIPAALASAVKGVQSLNDFMPHRMSKMKPQYTSEGATYHAVVPGDLATIYNFNPVFAGGITGSRQTVVVIEDATIYSATDWNTFRSTFGLGAGSLVQVNPAPASGANNCTNPGPQSATQGDFEATLDAEWAAAAAPSATIEVASCEDSRTTFGGLIALQNLINASNASTTGPAIMSISYGECEAENGAASNSAYYSAYQQAVGEGISVFVSAGDEGAASCDAGAKAATHGIGVSAFASTPYNVAVGGTDFADTYSLNTGSYWNPTNTATYESAKSYISEIPWNGSCASQLVAGFLGYASTVGASGFCNSSAASQDGFLEVVGGSGGPSGCFYGAPSTTGVVSGSCTGVAKPSWQLVLGNPTDGVRDIPDVSLFASNGIWGSYYVVCLTDQAAVSGATCSGAPSNWVGAGGTSFSSPIMAGIQALVNQKQGPLNQTNVHEGNPNPVYYTLARSEYGSAGSTACNAAIGYYTASSCIFYDVTTGDNDVDCTGTNSCFDSTTTGSGGRFGRGGHTTYGALSASTASYSPAFGASTGWDFTTGIGTVNVTNLVNNWP
jgi:subtilase family serine protease